MQSHYFQASDAFNKQQWINCIRQAKEAAALTGNHLMETGPCLETGLGGQIVLLAETGLSLCSGLGCGSEKGMWGDTEGDAGLSAEKDLSLHKESVVDGGMGLELNVETRVEGEAGPVTSEGDSGLDAVFEAAADYKVEGGVEDDLSGGADDIRASASPGLEQDDRDVMVEERSGAKNEDEMGMDISEAEDCEELTHRC